MRFGVVPMGTSAHEMFMVMAGIHGASDAEMRASHGRTVQDWWDEYGWGLSIALTDTYGTDFTFRSMPQEQARAWKGLRQDSGDPFAFAEKAIAFYEGHGIDPSEKMVIFSDGLDVGRMVELHDRLSDRLEVTFGWGTNLTNDLGVEPLSIIVKTVEGAGQRLVKLTDDPAKAVGSPADIARYKQIFATRP
jgi:nicotinate phosphoribosyltransferase